MENRRAFLKTIIIALAITLAALVIPIACKTSRKRITKIKTLKLKKGLVIWFSQAGHTERIGKIIAKNWERRGLRVVSGDIREIDAATLSDFDIIAAGSPVFYFEMPVPLRSWLMNIPEINGTAVASFVTFGGPGHNQHNTACDILSALADKGGVPVGMSVIGNMSTFAPTWSSGRSARVLEYKHLPNRKTYSRARKFAQSVLNNAAAGRIHNIETELSIYGFMRIFGASWWTKNMIGSHSIDREKCNRCGICVQKCPADAISLEKYSVNNDRCIACMGCVNNCPQDAHEMIFRGDRVYGFREFLRRNRVVIEEPEELQS